MRVVRQFCSLATVNAMDSEPVHYLEYFAGGVPAGAIFFSQVESLRDAVLAQGEPAEISETVIEACLIGLVAYFEAFAKNHFASLINICPILLENLKAKGRPLDVDGLEIGSVFGAPTSVF